MRDSSGLINPMSLLTYLDREKHYKLYSQDNRVIETTKGDVLYTNHYDPVNKGVRERFEKVTTQKRTVSTQRKSR